MTRWPGVTRALLALLLIVTGLDAGIVLAGQRTDETVRLPDFTASYGISKYDIKLASATYRLRYRDHRYHISQSTRLYGLAALFRDDTVDASSHVQVQDGKLRLLDFTYVQTGEEKDRDEHLQLAYPDDRDTTLITGVSRKQPVSIQTRGAVWDILSFQIPLMLDANEQTARYPYMAVINGELDQYVFERRGTRAFEFAGKTYRLLEMVRTDHRKKRRLHIWLAPELHNLPVIVENYRDDRLHSRMVLEKVQFNDEAALENETDDFDSFDSDE